MYNKVEKGIRRYPLIIINGVLLNVYDIVYICIILTILEKLFMKASFSKTLFSLAAAACLCSCVNEEYDLEKVKIDEIHILDDISAPLGGTKKFMLADLFSGFDSEEYLKTDKDGNYYVEFVGEKVSTDIEVPGFSFAGYSDQNPHKTTVQTAIDIPQLLPGIVIKPAIVTDPIKFDNVEFDIKLTQTDLPKEIIDVKYADVDSKLIVKFGYEQNSLPFSKIWISTGAQIKFPEWIIIGQAPSGFEKIDSHTLKSTSDIGVTPSNTSISIQLDALDFTKMPEGQGITTPGIFHIDAKVELSGSVYLTSDEYTNTGSGPFSPTLVSYLQMDPMTIQSVTVQLDLTELGSTEFDASLSEIAESMGDIDATIDLSGLRLNVGVASTLPADINLASTINTSYVSSNDSRQYELGSILIPKGDVNAPGSAYYSISEDGTGAPENYKDMAVQNWNTLLSPIPDVVRFSMLPSFADKSAYVTIAPGSSYSLELEYSFSSNAFGPAFRIETTQTFDGMGVSFDGAEISSAVLSLNAINTTPIELSVAAKAIDAEGNILSTITAEVDSSIKGGTLDNPAVTPVKLTLRSTGPVDFDGLILTFAASSASDCAVLNCNQYLQLTDMALSLPDGVTIKFDNNKE